MNRASTLSAALIFIAAAWFFPLTNTWSALSELPIIGQDHPFQLKLHGNEDLTEPLNKVIKEQRKQSLDFSSMESPRRAARFDRDVIKRWLDSQGYFDSQVQTLFSNSTFTHAIDTGSAYAIAQIQIRSPATIKDVNLDGIALKKGDILRAQNVLDAQKRIAEYLQSHHCLYETRVTYNAEINRSTATGFITFTIHDSPQVQFANTTITGTENVDPHYLLKFLTFTSGDCFNRRVVEQSRLELLQTGLLARVDAHIAPPIDGRVDIRYEITERNPRTIKVGVGYDSNTKAGAVLGWQHRNFRHRGERLNLEANVNTVRQEISSELLKQHFLQRHQSLTLTGNIYEETVDAYIYTSGEVGASIDRPLSERWAANLGVKLEFSRDRREDSVEDYALLSTPLILDFNRSNQLLDPTEGWALSTQLQPFLDLYNTNIQFTKTSVTASVYIGAVDWIGRPVLAVRAATGTTGGESLEVIPSAHRYYTGGGGSVRGYAYQMVGELEDTEDKKNVPVGGLSFAETSVELRLRFATNWGTVLFIDGGYAYPGERPDFTQDFLWGAGIGLRYFTSFAPIRFDVATPLDARRDANGSRIDDSIQIYISIGQAF